MVFVEYVVATDRPKANFNYVEIVYLRQMHAIIDKYHELQQKTLEAMKDGKGDNAIKLLER